MGRKSSARMTARQLQDPEQRDPKTVSCVDCQNLQKVGVCWHKINLTMQGEQNFEFGWHSTVVTNDHSSDN